MKEKVTIVPEDKIVNVEGEFFNVEVLDDVVIIDGISLTTIHAIQWKNGAGHVEFVGDTLPNTLLSGEDDYAVWIAPFVSLWEAVKTSLETAQAQAELEALTLYNSTEARAERVRTERDARITSCDWIISRHAEQVALDMETTLTNDEYSAWLAYRQELRDLPDVEGFPWFGGGEDDEECPWPSEPTANTETEE